MVPHAGTDSKIWREVVTLGGHLQRLAIRGSTVRAEVAVRRPRERVGGGGPSQPSVEMSTAPEIRAGTPRRGAGRHRRLRPPAHDLSRYPLLRRRCTGRRRGRRQPAPLRGGRRDPGDRSLQRRRGRAGPHPAAYRARSELLGIYVDEYFLPAGRHGGAGQRSHRTSLTEHAGRAGHHRARLLRRRPAAGCPALTRRPAPAPRTTCTRLADADLAELPTSVGAADPAGRRPGWRRSAGSTTTAGRTCSCSTMPGRRGSPRRRGRPAHRRRLVRPGDRPGRWSGGAARGGRRGAVDPPPHPRLPASAAPGPAPRPPPGPGRAVAWAVGCGGGLHRGLPA